MRRASPLAWSVLLGTLVLAVGATAFLAAQEESPPIFRSGVELIQIDAFVTDRRGNPVTGLTADDFEIIEEGRRQTITSVAHVDIPIDSGGRTLTTSTPLGDIQANGQEQGRIYVIVLGDASWQGALRARQLLGQFLDEHFGTGDLAAVVSLDRGGAMRFTNDRSLLTRTATLMFEGRDEDGEPLEELPAYRNRAREQTRMLGEIAKVLAAVPARRKAILLISETLSFDAFDVVDNPRSSFSRDAREALEPVTRGNIAVYTLHPGGAVSFGRLGRRSSRLRMSSLAHVTGGFSIGSDIKKAFERIVRENSSYYVLGYSSTETRRRGGYRRVEVRVTRPGLTVRSRGGYFVADPDRRITPSYEPPVTITAAITEALASPVPINTVPMRVFAAPFRPETGRTASSSLNAAREAAVALVVELDAASLNLDERDGALHGLIDVTSIGVSGTRTYPGVRHSGELTIQNGERGAHVPLRILSEIRLPPGRYQLRIAAGLRGGRTGSVLHDVVVPDFDREPLMLSGIALASLAAAGVPTLDARDTIGDRLPAPATTSRAFDRTDTIVLFTEIYENLWNDQAHTISLTTTLRSTDGRVVLPMTSERRSSRTPVGASGGHGFVATLPLERVPPGAYLLHVQADADVGDRVPVVREVPIVVR